MFCPAGIVQGVSCFPHTGFPEGSVMEFRLQILRQPAPACPLKDLVDNHLRLQRQVQNRWWQSLLWLLAALCLSPGGSLQAAVNNSLMALSQDGRFLVCSNRDSGTVTVVERNSGQKLHEIAVGQHPEGVAFLGDSSQLAVAVYAEDQIVFLEAETGKVTGRCEVFDEPYGIVSAADGSRIYVTLDYPGRVVEIETATRSILREISVEPFLRGIALRQDDQQLFVTGYYTGTLTQVDLSTGAVTASWPGGKHDNLSRQVALHPSRPKAYLPHLRSRVSVAHGEGSIFPLMSVIDIHTPETPRRTRVPLDSFIGARVTCNPWETAISPDGKTGIVVFAGTDDLFVYNVLDDNYREMTHRATLQLGHNPRAVRFSPDGQEFYVYNALGFEVVAYNSRTLQQRAVIPVTENPLGEEKLLGKRLFYSARQPMSSRLWISCASCHPDGQSDGRTWQNPEGLRNTQALAGMAWTHPIHWSADRDEVQDFEHTIRGPLMQGRGLIRGKVQESLENPKMGLSPALDALSAYANHHSFSLSPHAKNGLSAAALRGQKLFHSTETGCASCHNGPFYTDSRPDQQPFRLHNVGTGDDDPTELMGPAYDTPTLLGVYRTAPYFHDGRAKTLEEVLTTANPQDRHGKTSQLTAAEVADLVEFLKALPFEDPVPQARQAGLKEIHR